MGAQEDEKRAELGGGNKVMKDGASRGVDENKSINQ